MLFFSLAFLLGDVFIQHFTRLPNMYWVISIIFFIILTRFYKKIGVIAFTCGFLWSLCYAHMHLSSRLPHDLEGKTITVNGYIASIPDNSNHQTAFLFSLKKINN